MSIKLFIVFSLQGHVEIHIAARQIKECSRLDVSSREWWGLWQEHRFHHNGRVATQLGPYVP